MLSRAIIGSRDLLLNVTEAQRMALFFDHILIIPLEKNKIRPEDQGRYNSDLEFLRENKIVLKCGIEVPQFFSFQKSDGTSWNPLGDFAKDCDIVLPFNLVAGINSEIKKEDPIDSQLRLYAKNLFYNDAPLTAHAAPSHILNSEKKANAIEIILKQVPLPPENLPWADLIQFRSDEENKAKLRSLRIWLQKQASTESSPNLIIEELQQLLFEYEKYMEIQHKKYSIGIISTLLSSIPEVILNLKTLNFSSAFKTLITLRSQSLDLTQAEITAPGKEVSYFSNIKKIVS